jgi:two-component system LytT family sensor kinase
MRSGAILRASGGPEAAFYFPIAGGVSTIESKRQITTKIARPVATIMRVPSSAFSDCNRMAFSRSCEKLGILSSWVKRWETDGPTGVSKQLRIVHSACKGGATYTGPVKRRVQSAVTIFAAFTAVGLLFFGYRYLEYVANRESVSPWDPFINEVLTGAWMAALLFPLVVRFERRFPIGRGNWMTRLPLYGAALLAYSVVHTSLLWATRNPLYRLAGLHPYDYGVMTARYPMEFFHDVIAFTVIVWGVFLFDRHTRAVQLEGKLAQARLENLRLQLQPHFLFNALNAISSVVYEDPRKADAMIARLSTLLRRTISDAEAQMVPLEREIETLELYLDVMRQRFEDRLQVDVRIAPDVREALVPHLLLQPLVENSIRHGSDPRSNAVNVTVTADRDGGQTRMRIRDCGPGMPDAPPRRGTGISNTAERLEQLYGADHTLAFENCADGGLAVTVAVPYRT